MMQDNLAFTDPNMDTIGIIYAGGTFGSVGKPLLSLPPDVFLPILMSFLIEEFQKSQVDQAEQSIKTNFKILPNSVVKDSSQLTPSDFFEFYQQILQAVESGIRQFIFLTGTDTLSYIANFLAEALSGSDICVAITGAMRPLLDANQTQNFQLDPSSDAFENLLNAFIVAEEGRSGVWVVISDQVWPAQTVQKIHSHDLPGFVGATQDAYPANHFYSGWSKNQRLDWSKARLAELSKQTARLPTIQIVPIFVLPNSEKNLAKHISFAIQSGANALILLGFGAGNLPSGELVRQALKQANEQNCLVVIGTQCPFGGVSVTYQAGAWLFDYQVLSSGAMTLPAIFARLLWLLLNEENPDVQREKWLKLLASH